MIYAIINDMNEWHPLNTIWDDYSDKLEEVEEAELAEDIVWPRQLFMGEGEKEDVKLFVSQRIEEMVEEAQRQNGINIQWIGGFLFKSLVTGMMWERERIGK